MDAPSPRLHAAYTEPHRHYHTLAHVADCLRELAGADVDAAGRALLTAAIWWHDAVYDPTRVDNEEQSAALAERHVAETGLDPGHGPEVARLVRLTKGHAVEPGDRLGALLVSIDLAILGRPEPEYDAYAEAIRAEYAHVPDALYRAGRAGVLRRFLEAPAIYADPGFGARYEAQARRNLAREIARLTG